MYPSDQTSWYAAAKRLADEGYLVLTFDFSGYGESGGTKTSRSRPRHVRRRATAHRSGRDQGRSRRSLHGRDGRFGRRGADLFAGQLSSAEVPAVKVTVAGVITLSAPVTFRGLSAEQWVPRIYCPLSSSRPRAT